VVPEAGGSSVTATSVLVPCGGKSVGLLLQLKRAMRHVPPVREGRLLVADRALVTPAGSFVDGAFVVPDVGHPRYVEELRRICVENGVRVLLPVIDVDLDRLAPHLDSFAAVGTTVVCPPATLVDLCLDKQVFADFCEEQGLPHPALHALEALSEDRFPVFAKRRRGFGSIGSRVCRSAAEARAAWAADPELVFQDLIEAPEVSVDVFVRRDGRCTTRVPRVRDKVVGGEAQQSHTIRSPAIAQLVDRTVAALARRGLRGPLNVQVFATPEPTLIEVNTRLGSGSVLSNAATRGAFFTALLRDACGFAVEGDPEDYLEGLWLQRYWGDVIHDGVQTLGSHPAAGPRRRRRKRAAALVGA
jgi:carbamoyl-phosphate synthase large subunit